MSYRKKNILGAAALALVAVVFMVVYSSKAHSGTAHKANTQAIEHASILVARHEIKPGTPGNALQHGAFVPRTVSADAVQADAVTSAASVRGLVVRRKIIAGRPVWVFDTAPILARWRRTPRPDTQRRRPASGTPPPNSSV